MLESMGVFVEGWALYARSRGTPRISNGLLRRIRDFAQIKGNGKIDMEITKYGLEALQVDAYGLDEMDNKILTTMIDKFKGGPVGINTLSTARIRKRSNHVTLASYTLSLIHI